jgi:hypothetical protein
LFLNASCGMIIVAVTLLLDMSYYSFFFLGISMVYLVGGYIWEKYKLTRLPSYRDIAFKLVIHSTQIGLFILFVLNLIAIILVWFPPQSVDSVWVFLVYGGIYIYLLRWDFEKLGKELAQRNFRLQNPV